MKYWIPVSVAVLMAAFVVAGCKQPTPLENGWTYVGTWVNSAYNGNHGSGPAGKIVMTANSQVQYDNVTDTVPQGTFPMSITDDWTSGGDHYWKGTIVPGSFTAYFLMRVTNNNTVEGNSSITAYPASIDPAGSGYGIYTRQ